MPQLTTTQADMLSRRAPFERRVMIVVARRAVFVMQQTDASIASVLTALRGSTDLRSDRTAVGVRQVAQEALGLLADARQRQRWAIATAALVDTAAPVGPDGVADPTDEEIEAAVTNAFVAMVNAGEVTTPA